MGHNMPLVTIVLSTYNGDNFIKEQLDSLIVQTYSNVKILIRDDGSTDETLTILDKYEKNNEHVEVIRGENIGVVSSFLQLVKFTRGNTDYISFCDQDDVWEPDKVSRAISVLERFNSNVPLLYCGRVEIVDKKLQHKRFGGVPSKKPSVNNAIVENISMGCTSVINKAAIKLIARDGVHFACLAMHDWWIYLIVSAFGTVVYDNQPKIKHRQHDNNVVGSLAGIKFWYYRIKRHFGGCNHVLQRQTVEFLRVYGNTLDYDKKEILNTFVYKSMSRNIVIRFIYALSLPIYRQKPIDNLIFRCLIVLRKI